MAEFVDRRRREVEHFGQAAEGAARDAYGKAIRGGEDLVLNTQGQVMRFGASVVGAGKRAKAVATTPRSPRASAALPQTSAAQANNGGAQRDSWLDRSAAAKSIGGQAARYAGNAAGVVRGGVHAAEGLVGGAIFLGRVTNPLDVLVSAPGQSAAAQLVGAGLEAADYVKKGIEDPERVVRDVQAKAHQMRVDLDPTATPVAPTFGGELRRNFGIGANQGELAFDVGSLAVGGPLAKGMRELGAVSKAASAEKYMAQGFSPAATAYLAEPYPSSGMGHHFIPRRYKLPSILGGEPLPRAYSDGPFNRLAPQGMTRGDFYERHFQVDPDFHGSKLPARVGGGSWSGHALRLEKYDLPGRLWYGSPAPLKARVGGLGAAGGSLIYDGSEEEGR
jgi:hypothetical protein